MVTLPISGTAGPFSYVVGNFPSWGEPGQTLYCDGEKDSLLNLVQVQIQSDSTDTVTLQGGSPPGDPLVTGTGSWFALLFPANYFKSLSGITVTSLPAAGWSTSVQTSPSASGNDLLVVYATETIDVPVSGMILTLGGCNPVGAPSTDAADLGALFWNMSFTGGADGVLCDTGQIPQFWLLADAPSIMSGKPPVPGGRGLLAIEVDWTIAAFQIGNFQVNSQNIGRADDSVYYTPSGYSGIPNALALALTMSGGGDGIINIAVTAASVFTVTIVCDVSEQPSPPVLQANNLLAQSTAATMANQSAIQPANCDLPNWDTAGNGIMNGASLCSWSASFSRLQFQGGQATVLQIQNLVSQVAQAPGVTAVAFSWSGLPTYANGLVSLPLKIVAPVPAAIGLAPVTASSDYAQPLQLNYLAYAAQSATLSCISPSNSQNVIQIQTGLLANGVQSTTSAIANPFSGNDLNAGSITYALTTVPASAVPATTSVALTYTPPDLAGFVSGTITATLETPQPVTLFSFNNPLAGILGYSVMSPQGGKVSTGTSTSAPGAIEVFCFGGSVNVVMSVPNGPVTLPCPVSTWSPVTPPAADSIMLLAFIPDVTQSATTGPALYVWQVGMTVPQQMDEVFNVQPGYHQTYQQWTNLRLVQWPAGDGSICVATPVPGATSTADLFSCATVAVSWPQTGRSPMIGDVTSSPLLIPDYGIDAFYQVQGPFVMDGAPFPDSFAGVNSFNGGPCPVNAVWYGYDPYIHVGQAAAVYPNGIAIGSHATSIRGAFAYSQTECAIFSPGNATTPASATGVELPDNACAVDMDSDALHNRFVIAAGVQGANGSSSPVLYAAPYGQPSALIPLSEQIPSLPQGAAQTNCYAMCVSRQSGDIFLVGGMQGYTGMAIYMVPSGGGAPMPMAFFDASNYTANSLIYAMTLVENPNTPSQGARQ